MVLREHLDFLAAPLNANSTCKGRHRILPNANTMYNALTVSSELVSSPETLEQSEVVNLSEGRANYAPSETLPITPASSSETLTITPVSEGATSQSTPRRGQPRLRLSPTFRKNNTRSSPIKKNSSTIDNSKALVVYRPPINYRPPN